MFWNWTTALEDIDHLRREMDVLFERSQRYFTSNGQFPQMNLYNHDQKLVVVAELPGVEKADLDIRFDQGTLTLSGERKAPQLGEQVAALREERRLGRFEKSIRIPIEIDDSRITAQLKDGVLQIELPKPERIQPRQIAIQ